MRHQSFCSMLAKKFVAVSLGFFVLIASSTSSAQSVSHSPKSNQQGNALESGLESDKKWALVIHGGAGGDPTKWTDSQKKARKAGIEAALNHGREVLEGGGTALDAVERVIRTLEDNPAFNAGRGAVLTSEKRAELDASIMDGSNHACGAVASVRTVRNPISLARLVMTQTKHVLLIGEGADHFAEAQNVERVEPNYFQLKPQETDQSLYLTRDGSYLGTVGCAALDQYGNLAAGTSTGGLAGKMPGRVGDSPIIGAGNYADNSTCAISATGVGEEFIRHAICHDVSAQMKYSGRSLVDAVASVIHKTLRPDTGGLVAVGSDGAIAMDHNTPGMTCGAADSSGKFEIHLQVH